MRTLSRQLGPVLIVATAVVAVCCWRRPPDRGTGEGADPGSRVSQGYPWNEEEAARLRYLNWSYLVRVGLVRALLRGELSLWEAAACFRQVEAQRPPKVRPGSEVHRGGSEDERFCRHVLAYVCVELEDSGEEGLALELESELDERVRQGDLRLPAAPPGLVGRYDRHAP